MSIMKKIYAAATAVLISASTLPLNVFAEGSTEVLSENASEISADTEASTESATDTEYLDDLSDAADAPEASGPESAIGEYTVFEAIRIRRDLLAGGGKYTLEDYRNVAKFLVNKSVLSIKYFTLSYDTQGYDTSAYKDLSILESKKIPYKSEWGIVQAHLLRDGYVNSGWMSSYDGKVYNEGDTFEMPDCDVVMTPVWLKRSKISYTAGDYDDIIGNNTSYVMSAENAKYFIADSKRFSRKGYTITGWISSYDGKEYKPGDPFTVPAEDVTFEAVWSPATYDVNISANNGNKNDKITMSAVYNEEFVLPECEFTNEGKTFAGWKYNKVIYQPGESFIVPAMLTGSKIVVVATWQ